MAHALERGREAGRVGEIGGEHVDILWELTRLRLPGGRADGFSPGNQLIEDVSADAATGSHDECGLDGNEGHGLLQCT
ncbi:hypothetical protein GCM10011575_38380 [Microlunatus endophyticus]|uniref:Uncharacterized protein n=1 Tax=Microlunatus endophyticus TaxID=1716077 RepID=A0A917SEJ3_9ACTN|nr:hypothetical protein GCM10011575_38380 [Microlunatus endophyticus]